MLIKEYRILIPLSVEEYRIAQLYMIQKKSREESSGSGSGIDILVNKPYEDGPGGNGQYTYKIYHIGNHLPGWLRSILPKTALMVEEEAWNAYPYTKTRYTCPFVTKFSLEIETRYYNDGGLQDNVFQLSGSECRDRIIDYIDIVKDSVSGSEYHKEEDPRLFVSKKTGRGPLPGNWVEEYRKVCNGGGKTSRHLMTAYKLCRVEFHYWGMQTKIEKFIHDVALRKTMLRAHRQAWCWQDEYQGLQIEDIRKLEAQAAAELKERMKDAYSECRPSGSTNSTNKDNSDNVGGMSGKASSPDITVTHVKNLVESIASDSDTEMEYFDCFDEKYQSRRESLVAEEQLTKWNSLELIPQTTEDVNDLVNHQESDNIFSNAFREEQMKQQRRVQLLTMTSIDAVSQQHHGHLHHEQHEEPCQTTLLILVIHGGNVLDSGSDISAKKVDVNTFQSTFHQVVQQHYPALHGHLAVRLITCPSVNKDALHVLSNLSPYSADSLSSVNQQSVPIGALSLFATENSTYYDNVSALCTRANQVYSEFLKSDEGKEFAGMVCVVGDSLGSVLMYDALCRTYNQQYQQQQSTESHKSSGCEDENIGKETKLPHHLNFEVNKFFMFGSPLAHILAFRKLCRSPAATDQSAKLQRPACSEIYNLFHSSDPCATRMEPLLSARFSYLKPVSVSRYSKYPLGDGTPTQLVEYISYHSELFSDSTPLTASVTGGTVGVTPALVRRQSQTSNPSYPSGSVVDEEGSNTNLSPTVITSICHKWWGKKRIDYSVYSPEGLSSFPLHSLPPLFHASYWESADVVSFILRQVVRVDVGYALSPNDETKVFNPKKPREKWSKKITTMKVKNMNSNHRGNDVICTEDIPQVITAKFTYGPLDLVNLCGELVDIYIMQNPPAGDWVYFGTTCTDNHGKVQYVLPDEKRLAQGMYPVKLIVRGDHTSANLYLSVLPYNSECVVFSIDGSFTASMSIMGKDPKVRAGAVDVVRHWQELGYLILYITARPDMQLQKVVSWLAQHNFPHGVITFLDGLSPDPLGHKAKLLKQLCQTAHIKICAAYGSSKDISVYRDVGLVPQQIFIIGRASKKQQTNAVVLSEGYASHLSDLQSPGGSVPAQGNARCVIRKGCFSLPGQVDCRKTGGELTPGTCSKRQHSKAASKVSVRRQFSTP